MNHRLTSPPLLIELLRAVVNRSRISATVQTSAHELDWLADAGLGPMLYRFAPDGGFAPSIDRGQKLKAADLVSRVQTQRMLMHVERVIAALDRVAIVPWMLKGLSYATRLYPEAHLRLMGDIDLLVPKSQLPVAEQALLSLGFEFDTQVEMSARELRDYHHGKPLYHPEMALWVELHTAVMPLTSPARDEYPLSLVNFEREYERSRLGDQRVYRFRPEFELLYLTTAWCRDFHNSGLSGIQRQLVDACLMLNSDAVEIEWERILDWSRNALSGACLLVVLSLLEKHGAFRDDRGVIASLLERQPFVNRLSLQLTNRMLDRYVMAPEKDAIVSRTILSNGLNELIAKRPASRNQVGAIFNVVFPSGESGRRFSVGYQLDRLRSMARRLRGRKQA